MVLCSPQRFTAFMETHVHLQLFFPLKTKQNNNMCEYNGIRFFFLCVCVCVFVLEKAVFTDLRGKASAKKRDLKDSVILSPFSFYRDLILSKKNEALALLQRASLARCSSASKPYMIFFSLSVYVFLLFYFQRFSHPFHFTIILVDISAYIPETLFFSAKATDCLRACTHTHTQKSALFSPSSPFSLSFFRLLGEKKKTP